MSLDTRNRRASAICPMLPFRTWPTPDGSLATIPDRRHMAYSYRLLSEGGGGVPGGRRVAQPRYVFKPQEPKKPIESPTVFKEEDDWLLALLLEA